MWAEVIRDSTRFNFSCTAIPSLTVFKLVKHTVCSPCLNVTRYRCWSHTLLNESRKSMSERSSHLRTMKTIVWSGMQILCHQYLFKRESKDWTEIIWIMEGCTPSDNTEGVNKLIYALKGPDCNTALLIRPMTHFTMAVCHCQLISNDFV